MKFNGKLLIVGGSGFIGSHLAYSSVKHGYNTTVLSLNSFRNDKRIEKVNYLQADIRNLDKLKPILSKEKYSHVVNLGGYIDHSKFLNGGRDVVDAHFIGVENIVQSLDWSELKIFVQIGSSDEYGDAMAPQIETMRERPISSYSVGKLAAEQLLQMLFRAEGFPAVILRLFLVYGPGQSTDRFLPQIITSCLQGKQFPASHGQQVRDFCFIDDIVEGILNILNSKHVYGEIFNFASGVPVTIRDVLEQVINIIGKGTPQFGRIPYRNGENMSLYADISKAIEKLNWMPKTNLEDGLIKTINYYKNI